MNIQEIQNKLAGYINPGEQLLCGAQGEIVGSTAERVATATLVHPAGMQGQPHLIGLTDRSVMTVFWNMLSGIIKTRKATFIPFSDIANTEVKEGRNSRRLEILHRNGKMTRIVFKNTPRGNLDAADQLIETLDQIRRGGYRAQPAVQQSPPVQSPAQPAYQPPAPAYQPSPQPALQQINCPKCHQSIDADSKFCEHCGAKVIQQPATLFCQNCGKQLKPTAKFCSGCGIKMT